MIINTHSIELSDNNVDEDIAGKNESFVNTNKNIAQDIKANNSLT